MVDRLLTEQLRPRVLDDVILTQTTRRQLGCGVLQQHMLLEGPAGTGKTSVAYILTNKYPVKYINVSDESSVDIVRDKIKDWCGTISLLDENKLPMKTVILDEIDGASNQFFKALRGVMDQFSEQARFVATCNNINDVPEAIRSRFLVISFGASTHEEDKFLIREQAKKIRSILQAIGIVADKEAIVEFVKRNYPDLRTMINKIQGWQIENIKEIKAADIKLLNYSYRDILDIVLSKPIPEDNYKFFASKYANKVDDVLVCMGKDLPKYIIENHPEHIDKLPYTFIIIADAQEQRNKVIDRLMCLLSCVAKLQLVFHTDYRPSM